MTALGTFFSGGNLWGAQNVIYTAPKTTALAPAPAPVVNTGQSRVSPAPALLAPHIITTTSTAPTAPIETPQAPAPSVVSTPSGVADSGASGTAGSSPTTDSGRLLDMLGTLFKSQDVAQSMAPVSFGPTDTGTSATTTGGGSSGGIILVVIVLAAAAFWYFHTH
jgi:hypothetical protein